MSATKTERAVDARLILEFLDVERSRGLSAGRLKALRVLLFRWSRELPGDTLLVATSIDIQDWLAAHTTMTPKHQDGYRQALNKFYRWARAEGYVGANPVEPLMRTGLETGPLPAETLALLRRFALHQERRGLAVSTRKAYSKLFRSYACHLWPRSPLEAQRDHVEAFLATRKIGPRGRYHFLSHLSTFYRWAVDEELTDTDPTRGCPRPRPKRLLPRPISEKDLARAMRAARHDPRLAAMLALAAYQGLRCGEISSLEREDVLDVEVPPLLRVSHGKGDKERLLPLHPEVLAALRAHGLPRYGPVFPRWSTNQPVAGFTVSHLVNRHLHGLGIEATAHQLRHWFGTRVFGATRDLRLTQEMLGHASPETTAVYTAWSPGDAVAAVTGLQVRD